MDHVAEGAAEPPVLSIEMVNPAQRAAPADPAADDDRPVLCTPTGRATGSAIVARSGCYSLRAQFCPLSLPCRARPTPSCNRSIRGACSGLIVRLRGDYLVILGFIALVWLFARFVLESALGGALPLVVQIALIMYAWLAVFALIGGVLFERRVDIGLDDVHTPESLDAGDGDDDAPDERARDKEIDRIYAEWRGGAHASAWNTVLGLVGKSSDPMAELRWLYQRASQWPDGRLAERLARELLPRLLAQRSTGEALDLVRERLKKDARFRPAGSADLLTLVHLARAAGDRATARLLLQDFSKLYPGDPAQAMVDRLNTQLQ